MKTAEAINKDIAALLLQLEELYPDYDRKAINEKIRYYRKLLSYVETQPDEVYIKNEIDRIKAEVRDLIAGNDSYMRLLCRRKFNVSAEIRKRKEQIKTLKYLIEDEKQQD